MYLYIEARSPYTVQCWCLDPHQGLRHTLRGIVGSHPGSRSFVLASNLRELRVGQTRIAVSGTYFQNWQWHRIWTFWDCIDVCGGVSLLMFTVSQTFMYNAATPEDRLDNMHG